jgi:hypothetical protein
MRMGPRAYRVTSGPRFGWLSRRRSLYIGESANSQLLAKCRRWTSTEKPLGSHPFEAWPEVAEYGQNQGRCLIKRILILEPTLVRELLKRPDSSGYCLEKPEISRAAEQVFGTT